MTSSAAPAAAPAQCHLLVTGASGFLGWNVCRHAPPEWRLTGLTRANAAALPPAAVRRLDLTRYQDLKDAFRELRPDAVLHLAALSDPNRCQLEPEASRAINVEAAANLAGLCGDAGIPCVFTSTDLVFDGLAAPYSEDAAPNPVSRYGEHKVLAEQTMRERCPRLAVCRMPLMYGDAGPDAKSFLQSLAATLREGKPARLFTDEFRTPVSGRDAAAGLFLALKEELPLLHLGGRERISRFAFGEALTAVLGTGRDCLVRSRQADVRMPAARPPDVSLDSRRAAALGYLPGLVADELAAILRPAAPAP